MIKYLCRHCLASLRLDLLDLIANLDAGNRDYLRSLLRPFVEGVLLIDDVCILSKQILVILVDELAKLKSLPIIIIATSRLAPFSLPAALQEFFPFAMGINSLSVSCRREIIRSEVTGELDVLAKETAGLTRGELVTVCRLLKGNEMNVQRVMQCVSISERPHQMATTHENFAGYGSILSELRLFLSVVLGEDDSRSSLLQYSGIMLHGPPGNGKSLIIRKLHEESEVPFFMIEVDQIFSKYLGESEKAIREVFSSARFFAPCVVVIENIDGLGSKRNDESGVGGRVLSTLLNEIDGITATRKVLTIATTNAPELVDSALMRPGRFDRLIEIGYPTMEDRLAMFDLLRSGTPVSSDVGSDHLARLTEGFSCADVVSFFRFSALQALYENEDVVSTQYFEIGMQRHQERRKALEVIDKRKRKFP
jgi:ATP-dependent 26S proteasome regulatory subunit